MTAAVTPAARHWLGLASTLHAVLFAWAAHTLPWRPAAPLALVLWGLALLHAATAVAALGNLPAARRVWRALAIASLAAAVVLIGAIAIGAERMVVMFGMLGWNMTALLALIGVLVLGATVPMGLWGLAATRARAMAPEVAPEAAPVVAELERDGNDDRRRRRMLAERSWAYLVGGGLLLAVLWPLASGRDSFPLSNYPMFSRPRGQPVLFSVVASGARGAEWSLPSGLVGSDEVLQTKVLIERAVRAGRADMARLCENVAARVAGEDLHGADRARGATDAATERPVFVDIVSRRYDPVQYFISGPVPIEEQRLYRCDIADPARGKSKKARRAK
jgi:hypothetical protein